MRAGSRVGVHGFPPGLRRRVGNSGSRTAGSNDPPSPGAITVRNPQRADIDSHLSMVDLGRQSPDSGAHMDDTGLRPGAIVGPLPTVADGYQPCPTHSLAHG